MRLREYVPAFILALGLAAGSAQASTVDFTDANVVVTPNPSAPTVVTPFATQEVADGVTFIISNIRSGGANGLTFDTTGLRVGGGGLSTQIFSILTDSDVMINSFSGFETNPGVLTSPQFSFDIGGTFISTGDVLPATPGIIQPGGGSFSLMAGELLTITTINAGPITTGYLTGFDFIAVTTGTPVVPLPAGLPLLLAGLGGLAIMRRRQLR
jgi:hypothetical protein